MTSLQEAMRTLRVSSADGRREARRAFLRLVEVHPPEVDPPGWARACSAYSLVDEALRSGVGLPVSDDPLLVSAPEPPPVAPPEPSPGAGSRSLGGELWEARVLCRAAGSQAGLAAFVVALDADRGAAPGASPDHVIAALTRLACETPELDPTAAIDAAAAWLAHHGPEYRLLDAPSAERWGRVRSVAAVRDLLPVRLARMLALAVHHGEPTLAEPSIQTWRSSSPFQARRLWPRVNAREERRAGFLHTMFGVRETYAWLTDTEWAGLALVAMPLVGALAWGWSGVISAIAVWFLLVILAHNRVGLARLLRFGRR